MKQETKIQLLPFEIELVSDAELILTKNTILQKLQSFLFNLETKQKDIIKKYSSKILDEVSKISPKISKGENYRGLPWLMLDHPRYFEKNNVFAIRTMFWWGNFFCITLHLSGRFKVQLQNKILENRLFLIQHGFFLCVNKNEWEHHFESGNYKKISDHSEREFEEMIMNKPFLKIATKFPIARITGMEEMLCRSYEAIIKLLY